MSVGTWDSRPEVFLQEKSGGRESVGATVISGPLTGVSLVTSVGQPVLIFRGGQLPALRIHRNQAPQTLRGVLPPHGLINDRGKDKRYSLFPLLPDETQGQDRPSGPKT